MYGKSKNVFNLKNNKQCYSVMLSHCSYCGDIYDNAFNKTDSMKKCKCCNNITYRNPVPVAVGLLPFIGQNNNFGLLLVKRAIQPHIGEFCLPGGFVNW
jgi:hypothetical protein